MNNAVPDILVQYLDGELAGTEKQQLEEQLLQDSTMQEQLSSLRSTREAIRLYGLKQKVSGIHIAMMEEMQQGVIKMKPVGSKNKFIRYSIAIAASILLLVMGYLILGQEKPSSEKIFLAHYNRYELATMRNVGGEPTKAEKAYRAGDYAEVLRIHDAGEDHTIMGEFLCGAASLEVKNIPKAIKCFNEVLDANQQTGESFLEDEAEYYLSLSYIRNRDFEKALVLLHSIENNDAHTYNDKVNDKLIRQVEKLQQK